MTLEIGIFTSELGKDNRWSITYRCGCFVWATLRGFFDNRFSYDEPFEKKQKTAMFEVLTIILIHLFV